MTEHQEWLYRELRAVIASHLPDINDAMEERLMHLAEDVFAANPDAAPDVAYAVSAWRIDDILGRAPALTEAEAHAFLRRYEDDISDRSTERGWRVIETFLPAFCAEVGKPSPLVGE